MMNNFYTKLVFVVFALLFAGKLCAQENIQVKGIVSDTTSKPIPGVSVTVKGGSNGAVTDGKGYYSLNVKPNAILVFSSVGFSKETIAVNGLKTINVTLKHEALQGDEVVITALGRKQLKEAVTGSVVSVKPGELKIPASNLTNALAGRVSGLIAFQPGGQPGMDNSKFFIRGVTTFGYKQDPLILIDNIELSSNDLARVQVDDIEDFAFLKDAAATAQYGARGANGVIMVTTKRGKVGKARVGFRLENSISQPTQSLEIADPITYMKLYNNSQTTRNALAVPLFDQNKIYYTAATIKGEQGSNPYVYPAVDWLDMLFKKRALTQRANFNVSGGGGVATYAIMASHNVDNGILKTAQENVTEKNNVKLKNSQLRANVDINVTKTTKVGVSLWGNFTEYGGPLSGSGLAVDLYSKALHTSPVLFPAFYEPDLANVYKKHILFGNFRGGSDNSVSYANPYADLMKGFQTFSESRMLAQLDLNQDLEFVTPGLSVNGLLSTNRYSYFDFSRQYNPFFYTVDAGGYDQVTNEYKLTWINQQTGSDRATEYLNYSPGSSKITTFMLLRGILNYRRDFGRHGLKGFVTVTRQQTVNPNATNPQGQPDLQYTLPYRNLNYTGQASYSFMNKYFVELNAAYNGSERFAEANRFGFFPVVSASWVLSNEAFWKGTISKIFNRLKIRGSYGIVGNDAIGAQRFFYLSNINLNGGNPATFGYTNNTSRQGVTVISYPNPAVTWEKSRQTNLAVEATVLKELNITAEFYKQYRYDILMQRASIPNSVGLESTSAVSSNLGIADSRGIDLNLNYKKNFGNDWFLSGLANATITENKYLAFEEPQYREPWRYKTGQAIGLTYGYIAERLFVDDKEAQGAPPQVFSSGGKLPKGGDIKYRDVNEDGIISEKDKVPIGLPTSPQITYGFGLSAGYKNFDLSFFCNGNARVSFFVDPVATSPFINQTQLLKAWADSHWSEENQDLFAQYPRLGATTADISNNLQPSSWWLRNGSFLRLKSVELGYTLPKKVARTLKMMDCRVYVTGLNLLTFSKFKTWDPEQGGNAFNYPIQKVFNLGLNVQF